MNKRKKELRENKQKKQAWNPLSFIEIKANWFILLLIVVPLLQSDKTIDPNISIRFIAQSVFISIYILYFYVFRRQKISWNRSKLVYYTFLSLLAFTLWSSISLFHSINWSESLYELSRLLLNIATLFLMFLAVMEEDWDWGRISVSLTFLALVLTLIGFDQLLHKGITHYQGTPLPSGTMANRNLHGSFLVLLFPFVLYGIYLKTSLSKGWYYLILILTIVGVFYASTRSAWISGFVLLLSTSIILFIKLSDLRKSIYSLLIVVFSCICIITLSSSLTKKHTHLKEKTTVSRENKKSRRTKKSLPNNPGTRFNQQSINERLITWQETLEMCKSSIFTGVGLGNWKIELPKYSQRGTRSDYGQIVKVRPHNVYLLQLSETGVIGFILFFLPWILIFIMLLRTIRTNKENKNTVLSALILGVLLALAIDSFFSFPNERIAHSIVQWSLMGMAMALYSKTKSPTHTLSLTKWNRSTIIVVILVIGFLSFLLGTEKYKFEHQMNRARSFYTQGKYYDAISSVETGKSQFVTLEINNDPIDLIAALSYKALKQYDAGLLSITIAQKHNPYSTRILNTKGGIYTDAKKYDQAIPCFQQALKYSPKHQISIQNLALNFYLIENYVLSINYLAKLDNQNEDFVLKLRAACQRKLSLIDKSESD